MPEKHQPVVIGYLRSGKPVYQLAGGDGTENPDGGDAGKTPEQKPETTPKVISMTQEEFDARIEARLARERNKYSDYEELKTKVAESDKAKQTETERLTQERDEAKNAGKTAVEKAHSILRKAAIKVEAATAGAVDPDVVVALLAADESVVVDKDDEVQGAKVAVKKLLDEKPYLKGTGESKLPNTSGAEHKGQDTKSLDEQIAAAEKAGNFRESMRLKNQKAARAKE